MGIVYSLVRSLSWSLGEPPIVVRTVRIVVLCIAIRPRPSGDLIIPRSKAVVQTEMHASSLYLGSLRRLSGSLLHNVRTICVVVRPSTMGTARNETGFAPASNHSTWEGAHPEVVRQTGTGAGSSLYSCSNLSASFPGSFSRGVALVIRVKRP